MDLDLVMRDPLGALVHEWRHGNLEPLKRMPIPDPDLDEMVSRMADDHRRQAVPDTFAMTDGRVVPPPTGITPVDAHNALVASLSSGEQELFGAWFQEYISEPARQQQEAEQAQDDRGWRLREILDDHETLQQQAAERARQEAEWTRRQQEQARIMAEQRRQQEQERHAERVRLYAERAREERSLSRHFPGPRASVPRRHLIPWKR